jgi:citrate lyase subunit alpha/citrate CoA-transferase
MAEERKYEVKDDGEYWINACGRRIPKMIPGYGPTVPFAGAFAAKPKSEGTPSLRPTEHQPTTKKMRADIATVLREFGACDGMTVSFHHHLRGGDGVLVPVMREIRKLGIKGVQLAPSSLHDGQKELIEMFKDGTVACIHTGANDSLGLSVSAGDLRGMMVVRSHGGRVRAIKEGEIKIDIAFIAASASDDQGNCNGLLGKSACGPLGYSGIDAKLAKHVVVVTDNLVEYPCTPISISENYVDRVVVVPSIGDNKKIVSGTTRLSTDPQVLLIGEYCARLMDALGLLTPELVFQAGAGGTSLTAMTALSAKLAQKKISARMANGGTTAILVDMLKKGLVRKLTTCQAFDLSAVRSMVEDYPRHVETDIDQYANPHNSGNVCNMLDVMVAGGTEVDVHFNCNVNTHSDGSF